MFFCICTLLIGGNKEIFGQQNLAHKSAHLPIPFSRIMIKAFITCKNQMSIEIQALTKMLNQKKRQRRTGGQDGELRIIHLQRFAELKLDFGWIWI